MTQKYEKTPAEPRFPAGICEECCSGGAAAMVGLRHDGGYLTVVSCGHGQPNGAIVAWYSFSAPESASMLWTRKLLAGEAELEAWLDKLPLN
jgi:hypothetical protein